MKTTVKYGITAMAALALTAGIVAVAATTGRHSSGREGNAGPAMAQCRQVVAAERPVLALVSHFVSVTGPDSLERADLAIVSDPAVTGSETSEIAALSAAATGSPATLAADVRKFVADFRAFEAADDVQGGTEAKAVAVAANGVVADSGNVQALCPMRP